MKIYDFEKDKKKLIEEIEVSNLDDVLNAVGKILKEKDINSPYQRYLGTDKSNIMYVDYGSYSKFLMLKDENLAKYFKGSENNEWGE